MLIYMKTTRCGSPDGHSVKRYRETQTYDIPHSLACEFVNKGWGLELPEEDRHDGINGIQLSTNVTLHNLPNSAMSGFHASGEARRAVGEVETHNID